MSLQFTRIVADENVPKEVVENLRAAGCKEVYWISESKSGISDPDVWRLAAAKRAVLLTGDVRFLPQLSESEYLNGPDVVEYSANGFDKAELQDPRVMTFIVQWVFTNNHHSKREHLKIAVDGAARTRRQMWGPEKARRKKAGI